jgi:hypothetical protein
MERPVRLLASSGSAIASFWTEERSPGGDRGPPKEAIVRLRLVPAERHFSFGGNHALLHSEFEGRSGPRKGVPLPGPGGPKG